MLPWLFNIFMDRCMREMKAKVGNLSARLKIGGNGRQWWHVCLQRVVDEFYSVCTRRKLKVNIGKNKGFDFHTPYSVSLVQWLARLTTNLPSSILDEGRRHTAHPSIHPPKRVG